MLVGGGRVNEGDGEGIWLMVFIYIHEMMKHLAIVLSGQGRGCRGDGGGNLTSVQCKATGNWYNEFLLYNEYMLIKMKKKTFDIRRPIKIIPHSNSSI
jgi:hypothetical protein